MTDQPPKILSLHPDPGWVAELTASDRAWTEPLIGWAVMQYAHGGTGVEAALLVEGKYPDVLSEYLSDHGCELVEIRRRGDRPEAGFM